MLFAKRLLVVTALVAIVGAVPAEGKTLRIGAQADAGTMDPHAQNIQTTISVVSMVYDALVTRDKDLIKAPALATGWSVEEPTVWRFTLRPDVTFHDGAAFDAEDVVFSVARAQSETSQFKGFVASISEVRVIDPLTVAFVTNEPDPLLVDKLTYIFMMDKGWAEANNVQSPQNLVDEKETYAVLNANGTGPYRLMSREPDARTVMARFDGYWGDTDGDIEEIIFNPISSDPTRIAALASGELDLLIDVPAQFVSRLEADPNIDVEQTNEFRTLFFGFELGSDVLTYGDAGGTNPFRHLRVRQAIDYAIDADTIARTVMRGLAIPTGQILAPGNVGYDESLDDTVYDPDKARSLLADAGYPDGFSVTLDCPNNRYINDEQICRAVTAMLAQVGIRVSLNLMPRAQYFPKLWERDASMYLMGFNSPYFDGMYMAESVLMTRNDETGEGIYNYSLYSDSALDETIRTARSVTDPDLRDAKIQAVYRMVKDDMLYVPVHHQVLTYAMRTKVDAVVRPDNWLEIRWVTME